jgi:hypothetical protein
VRLVALACLLGACGVPSLALSIAQSPADPLPAVAPLALVAAACSLLLVAVPLRAPRVTDTETDVIASLAPLLLGGWMLATAAGRLGDHFWEWRPDLVGLWLCAIGIACVLLGTRAAGFLAAPLAAAALAATPITQLLLTGLAPGPGRAALVAAFLTGLPFLVKRAPARRVRLVRLAVAAAGVLGAAAAAHELGAGAGVAGLIGASSGVIAGAAYAGRRRPGTRRGVPLGTLGRSRVALLLVAGGAVAAIELGDVPRWPIAAPGTYGSVAAPPGAASYELRPGVTVAAWPFDPGGPDDQLGMVVLTSGQSVPAVVTVPFDGLVHWPVDACPTVQTLRLDGLRVDLHLYADVERGFRWSTLQWVSRRPGGGLERVDAILAQGPSGEPSELPAFAPDLGLDAERTAGRFVAARHLDCQLDVPQGADVLGTVLGRVLRGTA